MPSILACLDGSQLTPTVCQYSGWASSRLNAPISLLHVVDKSHYPTPHNLSGTIGLGSSEHLLEDLVTLDEQRYKIALEQGHRMLQEMQRTLSALTKQPIEIRQRHGNLDETLHELQSDYQLVIIGRQGQQTQTTDKSMGSQLDTITRLLHAPLLITATNFTAPQRVMLAYDGTAHSEKCLSFLLTNSLLKGLSLHLVTVGDVHAQQLAEAQQRLAHQGIHCYTACLKGEIVTALNQYQQQQHIDLLIMGAYGHSRIRQLFLGSTTNALIQSVQVALLLIR